MPMLIVIMKIELNIIVKMMMVRIPMIVTMKYI